MTKMSGDRQGYLDERLDFIGLGPDERARLARLSDQVTAAIGPALDNFYKRMSSRPQLARMFSEPARLGYAKDRQSTHWAILAKGRYDATYLDNVKKVGAVHARIGLAPDWYISGYALIVEALIGHIVGAYVATTEARRRSLFTAGPRVDATDLSADISVVVKAALLDIGIVIEQYLDALAEEKRQLEAQKARDEAAQGEALAALAEVIAALANGDLSRRMPEGLPGNFRAMAENVNAALQQISGAISVAGDGANGIGQQIDELANGTDSLSDRTTQQASSLEQSSAALHELAESIASTSREAGSAATLISSVRVESEGSNEIVGRASAAMEQIEKGSAEIGSIIALIDGIAFQTNLLALNASVEAARAGDAGRGFSVVAQEVRALAQRSAEAAGTIKGLVSTNAAQVKSGRELVEETRVRLNGIAESIAAVSQIAASIANAASEQSNGLGELNQAMSMIDGLTQQNASLVDRTNANTQALRKDVDRLNEVLSRFIIAPADAAGGTASSRRKIAAA
jgi:methyl-accepting chemotaxis protein